MTEALLDFVIAGPPKCGTSSLYQWLCDHPGVCGSQPKETFYFMDRTNPLRSTNGHDYHREGMNGYGSFFGHCGEKAALRFEATTHYVYQQTAREILSHMAPPPHVIFILRKPAERVYSSFQYTTNNLANVRGKLAFAEYVQAVLDDKGEQVWSRFASERSRYVLRRDVPYSRYVNWLPEWADALDESRFHLFLFEELCSNPRSLMRKIALKVGFDPTFYDDYNFRSENKTRYIRHSGLHRVTRRVASHLRDSWFKDVAKRLYLTVQARNKKQPSTQEDEKAKARLERHFAPYNERLSTVFDIDLSVWQ